MRTTTMTSGTQEMQMRTTFSAGQGWTTERFDMWRGEWTRGAMSSPTWFSSQKASEMDMEQRTREFMAAGWTMA